MISIMKKREASKVVSVTVPVSILKRVEKYCANNFIPRTSFFVKAAKNLLDEQDLSREDNKHNT